MSDTLRDRCAEMYDDGMTTQAIARTLGANIYSVENALKNAGCMRGVSDEKALLVGQLRARGLGAHAIQRQTGLSSRAVQNAIAFSERQGARLLTPEKFNADIKAEKEMIRRQFSGELNILLLFDPHAPHTHRAALKEALTRCGTPDLIVIGGDTMDFSAWSKFPQDGYDSMADERRACMEIEAEIIAKCPHVWKILGNHDERVSKVMDVYMAPLHQRLEGGAGGPRAIMLKAQAEVSKWYNSVHSKVKLHQDWYLTVGNGDRPNFITHADRYTATRLKTPENVLNRLLEMGHRPQSVCIGHLHRYVPWSPVRGVWLSEIPCLCHRPKYSLKAKAGGGHHHIGHGILRTDKQGNFIPNESTVYFSGGL